jgi:hypothetical protein
VSSVSAVFYTSAHRIEGLISLRERLSEALNDPLTDYIDIADARISSLGNSAKSEVIWPKATIPKKTVLVATLDLTGHESSNTRIDKAKPKSGSQVGAIVDSIEVYGTGHLTFQGDAKRVLTTQLSMFFPVTDATIILSHRIEDNRFDTGLALVNREKVRAFTLA